jgi:hypothetical protein
LRSRCVVSAAHAWKIKVGALKLSHSRPKVKIFNRKVKEKDREYSHTARLANGWEAISARYYCSLKVITPAARLIYPATLTRRGWKWSANV